MFSANRLPIRSLNTALFAASVVLWASSTEAQSPTVQRGKAFVLSNCSACHSIDKITASPLAIAPPFRNLHLQYPVENLEESLGEGILTGHPTMPEFKLDPGQVSDVIAYLKSLE